MIVGERVSMKQIFVNRKFAGITWSMLFSALFIALSVLGRQLFTDTAWYVYSSLLRLTFGVIILWIIGKLYGRSAGDVFRFHQAKAAWIAATGFLLYLLYYTIDFAAGVQSFSGLRIDLIISQLFLQQITTGFYEELCYRTLLLDGYFFQPHRTKMLRLAYAAIGFLLFGGLHVLGAWNLQTFLCTGAIGFAFSAIYLCSRNIVLPIFLHFVYDVFANLTQYVHWNNTAALAMLDKIFTPAIAAMFILSLAALLCCRDTSASAQCAANVSSAMDD